MSVVILDQSDDRLTSIKRRESRSDEHTSTQIPFTFRDERLSAH